MAKYIHVTKDLPERDHKLLVRGKQVRQAMGGNTRYPSPSPTMAALDSAIKGLDDAITNGTKADRKAAAEALRTVLRHLGEYVEGVAESMVGTLDLLGIEAAVQSANYTLRKVTPRPKYVFGVDYGPATGTVDLTAPASSGDDCRWATAGKPKVTSRPRKVGYAAPADAFCRVPPPARGRNCPAKCVAFVKKTLCLF